IPRGPSQTRREVSAVTRAASPRQLRENFQTAQSDLGIQAQNQLTFTSVISARQARNREVERIEPCRLAAARRAQRKPSPRRNVVVLLQLHAGRITAMTCEDRIAQAPVVRVPPIPRGLYRQDAFRKN